MKTKSRLHFATDKRTTGSRKLERTGKLHGEIHQGWWNFKTPPFSLWCITHFRLVSFVVGTESFPITLLTRSTESGRKTRKSINVWPAHKFCSFPRTCLQTTRPRPAAPSSARPPAGLGSCTSGPFSWRWETLLWPGHRLKTFPTFQVLLFVGIFCSFGYYFDFLLKCIPGFPFCQNFLFICLLIWFFPHVGLEKVQSYLMCASRFGNS